MNLKLGEFVVMPNHIHAIIIIGKNDYNSVSTGSSVINRRDAMHCVSTIDNETVDNENQNHNDSIYKNQFAPQSKNLSSIIRGYKSAVTTFA